MLRQIRLLQCCAWAGLYLAGLHLTAQSEGEALPSVELMPFPVGGVFAANEEPAASFGTVVTRLRSTPRIELQSRGLPEAQSDLIVRGGVFEQTGMAVGALPLFDPQTGHYAAEVPFAPIMLSAPRLAIGTENALYGFNANLATVRYQWAQIEDTGYASLGFGSDRMRHQSLYSGFHLSESSSGRWATDVSLAHAEGDGTVTDGDFRFKRFSGRVQYRTAQGQTDFFAGYLDKFYGWPGLYIGNTFGQLFPETEDYQTWVGGIHHRQSYGEGSHWEAGAAFRELRDTYQVNRYNPNNNFQHLTQVWTASMEGVHALSSQWSVLHNWTLLYDDLVRSTALTHGDATTGNDFTKRTYFLAGLAPEYRWITADDAHWSLIFGVNTHLTSEDGGHLGGVLRLSRETMRTSGLWSAFVDLSRASQVAGYTALRSNPNGLFGGNPNLGREYSTTLEAGLSWESGSWQSAVSVFGRHDDDLVDWTWSSDNGNRARQANPVEVDTLGAEWLVRYQQGRWEAQLSYAWIDKSIDYREASVDASYYVGNFARHRITFSGILHPHESLDLRMDLGWREQAANALRTSSEQGTHLSLSLGWRPDFAPGFEFSLMADNLTDSGFEFFPGTPPVGRHYALRGTYRW